MAGGLDNAPDLSDATPTAPTIRVHVKFSGRAIPISATPDSTVAVLKSLLQPLTNVLIRGQKLIFKGKVLTDTMTLEELQIRDGSKIMLIASQGLHQGEGPITKNTFPNSRVTTSSSRVQQYQSSTSNVQTRSKLWKLTGVVALSESHLEVIPEEIWACGSSVRVLDASRNYIKEISTKICSMKSMTKLCLSANQLASENISWEGLSSLSSLTDLSLNKNHLSFLPSTIGALASLRKLDVANNKLTYLPDELGSLNQLQIFHVQNNRICSITSFIGNCSSLVEVDFSSNHLKELPEAFGDLLNLKALHIRNNRISSLPASLFKKCYQLTTLDLHGTEITNDTLRQLEGWGDFDARRRLKHQKQLDFGIGCSGGFDEGADEADHR